MSQSFFIESLSKNIFEVGGPKNRRFWAYFQKLVSEISTSSEKVCFLILRFFRKIEEMGGYFWGCALKFVSEKLINVAEFRCEKKRDRGQTRRFIKIAKPVIFLSKYGSSELTLFF